MVGGYVVYPPSAFLAYSCDNGASVLEYLFVSLCLCLLPPWSLFLALLSGFDDLYPIRPF